MTATRKQLAAWADLGDRGSRQSSGLFLAEGAKVVAELRQAGWPLEAVLATDEAHQPTHLVTPEQMARVSAFRTPPEVLAVAKLPPSPPALWRPGQRVFVLDDVQDPGNVGTIVRTAGWFGFDAVVCSPASADPWQPKAIQASMGAFLRVDLLVAPLADYLATLPAGVAVVGTFLDGESLLGAELPRDGVVVLGNEGHGISPQLEALVTRRITIPRFGRGGESLNVAAVCALVAAEFRRTIH